MSGTTQKTGGSGCTCHGTGSPAPTVRVWIDGPPTVTVGSVNSYRLLMTGGPAVNGGFDLAAGSGTLAVTDSATTYLLFGELTQTDPKPFINDTVFWEFGYVAPPDTGLDTLYSVGNSVNGDFIPPGDEFNFGEMFVIGIRADSVMAAGEMGRPVSFRMEQNYPNPFNPTTKIRYSLSVGGNVELTVYDVAGRIVALPVRGRKAPGSYQVEWDAAGCPAGIYFYRLVSDGEARVRKMALIR